jgi:hypothetical protein
MHALDEVTPAFGVSEEELQQVVQNGIIHYAQQVNVSGQSQQELMSGYSQRWKSFGGTSPKIRPYTVGRCSYSRSFWCWKDRFGSYHRHGIRFPIHQAHFPRNHGWILGAAKDCSTQQGVYGQLQESYECDCRRQLGEITGLESYWT